MEISILLLTYNDGKYIRQALDSVLAQEISVPYEILIMDDASTDATRRILREYKKRYPQLISLYLRKKNSCHPTRNVYSLVSKARGRYLAFLEGDDYWTSPLKLGRQHAFLEQHKEYSACVTDILAVDQEGREIPDAAFYERKADNVYTVWDFQRGAMAGRVGAMLLRNCFQDQDCAILYTASPSMADYTVFMLCVLQAPIYQMDGKMAAYRRVSVAGENNFNSIQKENAYRDYLTAEYWIQLENYMKRHFRADFNGIMIKNFLRMFSARYPTEAMMRLIAQSENRGSYLLLYIVNKYLRKSNYILEGKETRESGKGGWGSYRRDRRRVILFGAGAVAGEYLDRYAWKGDVLFLVDNDAQKQNQSFRGYLVKEPGEILKYKNIKILITNQHCEDEIRRQLQGMGIEDSYGYCSMQSGRLGNRTAARICEKYGDERNGKG